MALWRVQALPMTLRRVGWIGPVPMTEGAVRTLADGGVVDIISFGEAKP